MKPAICIEVVLRIFGNTIAIRSSSEDLTIEQKLLGKSIWPVWSPVAVLPFPKVRSCSENLPAKEPPDNLTLTFVFSCKVLTLLQGKDYLRYAFNLSALVALRMTSKVCLKSPARSTMIPPIMDLVLCRSWSVASRASSNFLWAIVHSFQMMFEVCCTWPLFYVAVKVLKRFGCPNFLM